MVYPLVGRGKVGQMQTLYTVTDAVICLLLSFILSTGIGWFYGKSHAGASYAQSFVHSMVLTGMVVSLIMLLLGSSASGGLVMLGAVSVVRYRTALKEPRDVAFVFLVVTVCMAVGTKSYLPAVTAAAGAGLAALVMSRRGLFESHRCRRVLRLRVPQDEPYDTLLPRYLAPHVLSAALVQVDSLPGNQFTNLTYNLVAADDEQVEAMMAEMTERFGRNRVILTSDYNAEEA